MDSRSGSGDIRDDCWLSRLRRERHRLLLRVSGGRINAAAGRVKQRSDVVPEQAATFSPAENECKKKCINKWRGALTGELWNDGRRVLVQVVHTACDGVRRDRDSGHDHPAVVRVEAGRQARQT